MNSILMIIKIFIINKATFNYFPITFKTMRLIVTFGWAIYPLGYFFGYLTGSSPTESVNALNIIYNLADVLNKIAFGLIIWNVAVQETESQAKK